jgi:signal transduction histidine kinase/iron only hydrogenase large subunit-like protein
MVPSVIQTIKQNCRRCYSCVRACPAKAIRVVDGLAAVVPERCLGCGNCTVVCSQNAKAYASGVENVERMLAGGARVAALVAPSFPADPLGQDAGRMVGTLRALGFRYVVEVAYGADLVSAEYERLLSNHTCGTRIATACPAVVEYVRKYNPAMVDDLVPIVSPMIATALAVQAEYGGDVECVFIGPCIAKKLEARDPLLPPVVAEVLTFEELHRLLAHGKTDLERAEPSEFDPPHPGVGRVFPLAGGLLKAANLERNVVNPDIVVLTGHEETAEVLSTLEPGNGEPLLVEAMMCRGCYSGPGIGAHDRHIVRKRRVKEYVKRQLATDRTWRPVSPVPLKLDRSFVADDQRLKTPTEEDIRVILAHTNKFTREDELNCGACGYDTCRAKAVAVFRGLAEEAMCLPFMIEQAERVCHELKVPWPELREVHRHLINTEKLASMGQMAAGVAHELNNPLGTILLYTSILSRKLGGDRPDLAHDVDLLVTEAQRCKKIIGMLLDFARQSRLTLERTSISELLTRAVDESMFVAADGPCPVTIQWSAEPGLEADVDKDQFGQVLVNLMKNGIEAMDGKSGTVRVTAATAPDPMRVRITVTDEGRGIAHEARDKVFQPFFTTKSIGKGTGLGLPIAYGIVKMHRGSIWFDSEIGRGTTFIIDLPKTQSIARSFVHEEGRNDSVH